MVWLASFPRSGNTFLRNILFEVYGLASSTYHRESEYPVDANFKQFPVIKTHELPGALEADGVFAGEPVVYLVRDGRDAMCSIAHHRSNLIAPGSDYEQNLREAILADRGSFFGGWSQNVEQWCKRADLVIRFEDLIKDPLSEVERLRTIFELPQPDAEKLPTFESLKSGIPEYGAKRHQEISEDEKKEHSKRFFRRGKAGGWREEMPGALQELFWSIHGDTMDSVGYSYSGDLREPHRDMDYVLREKLGLESIRQPERRYRVLMEANKLVSSDNDGVKRYQVELLKAMFPAVSYPQSRWQIDLYIHGKILPLDECGPLLFHSFSRSDLQSSARRKSESATGAAGNGATSNDPGIAEISQNFIPEPGILTRIELGLVRLAPSRFVEYLKQNENTIFHVVYDGMRSILVRVLDFLDTMLDSAYRSAKRLRGLFASASTKGKLTGYDLIHLPLKQHFRAFRRNDTKKLITFHDLTHLYFPQFHTRSNIRNARQGVNFAVTSGADIIAVSEATRQNILADLNVDAARVHLIHEAADPRKFSARPGKGDCKLVRLKYGLRFDGPYIICLSTLEPRKNLKNTIRAFVSLREEHPDLDLSLVIAGKQGWDADGIYALAKKAGGRVFFTGFVDDQDLAYLYSDALCLSYLSFYEGFGLPVLEAMRCGTPVVFGNNSSMIEVAGEGGLPADPDDLQDIKMQYMALYQDPGLRRQKSLAALRQANQFSWRKAAIQTLDLYQELIDGSD